MVVSNGSSESSSTNSQESNVEKGDGTHQLVTGDELNEKNGNNCSTDDHIQTNVESCRVSIWSNESQYIGTVGGVEIDDCPSKDTCSKSIDDLGNWTLCLESQDEDEDGSERDSSKDASKH